MERLDFSEVRGNDAATCALAAAAGSRIGVVLTGPPGIAKTMIARRAPGLLGPLAGRDAAWMIAEYTAIGLIDHGPGAAPGAPDRHAAWHGDRPFRAPHHTVSAAAMSGATQNRHRIACPEARGVAPYRCDCAKHGGKERVFRPGECHLARFGVLLLDDLIEFPRMTVDTIASTIRGMSPDTRPWLIATVTPCPCGWRGSDARVCVCPAAAIDRWEERISRHLRALAIGENIPVRPVVLADLRAATPGPSTSDLRARVVPASRIEAAS